MNRHIALVEDDEVISGNYADFLRSLGFCVDVYRTEVSALQGLFSAPPDLVLLDVTLDGERDAGFALCLDIRRRSATLPIVFLSCHDGDLDRVSGFRLGADDYLGKDVSLEFLAIRIEALFRRIETYAAADSDAAAPVAPDVDGLRFDLRTSTVTWKARPLDLRLTQFWMLRDLHRHAGQPRSYDALMRAASITVEPNTVSAHVKAIRRAFVDVDPSFDGIRTERGRGYRWVGP